MRVCRRCQYDLSVLEDSSICPECGCVQKDYIRPYLSGGEKIVLWVMGAGFLVSTAGVVVSWPTPSRWPNWFFSICFVGGYLSLLISIYILEQATNLFGPRWKPALIIVICAFPLFLLWLFVVGLLIAILYR
jgi:hypothetical protein